MTKNTKLVRGQHSATNKEVLKAVKDLVGKTEVQFSAVFKAINAQASKTDQQFDDVLEVINAFADETHQEFSNIKGEISGIKGDVSGIKGEILGIKDEISGINGRLTRVEGTMVTKDYLDDKMSDLRGDLVVMMRKEDTKLKTLVGVLKKKAVLDSSDVKKIYSLEPFAQ